MEFEELAALAARFDEVEQLIQKPEVIQNGQRYAGLLREHGSLKNRAHAYKAYEKARAELEENRALAADKSEDAELREMARAEVETLQGEVDRLREALIEALATEDENSGRNVILEIRAGIGGEEAALFAGDLYGMYRRYAEVRGWNVQVLDANPTDMGGFREIICRIKGEDAWSRLRFEGGGHRVQRVPKTEAQGRIHTSAATVAIMPEAEEVDIRIDPVDLEISVMRSQGPGGQSVNTTDSAVRIVHKPSGINVKCQDGKSQHQNKAQAMIILRSKLYEMEKEKADSERREMRGSQTGSGDRSERVRTYNFPQNRVTDHRLAGDAKSVSLTPFLEGDIDPLIDRLTDLEKLRLQGG